MTMERIKTILMAALCATSVIALAAACDNGPSAVAQKQAAGTQMASAGPAPEAAGPQADHRKDPVKLAADGKPMWSASRRFSAEESAQHSFERNGAAFGASTLDDFVGKAHAFVEHPPKGVQTLKRANGDTLYYDPKGNIFAVANKDGAPRTMFKPDDGAAYWDQQKAREAKREQARSTRRSRPDDDA